VKLLNSYDIPLLQAAVLGISVLEDENLDIMSILESPELQLEFPFLFLFLFFIPKNVAFFIPKSNFRNFGFLFPELILVNIFFWKGPDAIEIVPPSKRIKNEEEPRTLSDFL